MTPELREVHVRLEELDNEIAGTLAHAERLRLRRTYLLVDLNRSASPLNRLPPELIGEIFLFTLPEDTHTLPNPRRSPILLTHVCRLWRDIAVGLSTLWSSICISEILHCYPKPGLLEMLEAFLIRAENAPISMTLAPGATQHPMPLMPMFDGSRRSELFRLARHTSARWRELEIVRPFSELPLLLRHDEPWDFGQLEKLTILPTQGTRPERGRPLKLTPLTEAQKLRDVHLSGFSPRTLLLPWWQLTNIHMENLYPVEILDTLSCTASVVDASFSVFPSAFFHLPNTNTNDTPTGRPRALKSLTITGENHITPLLDHLMLYPFKKFHLAFGPNNEFAPLVQFLTSFPSLTDIALEFDGAITLPDLGACLEQMPRAQTLILACRNGLSNGPLPHALATNNEILPALKSLTLIEHVDRYNEPPVDTSMLAEMLRARWGQGLKEFRLSTTQAMFTPEQMAQFVDLAKAGMKVKIQSHGSGPFLKVWFDSDIAKQW